MLNWLYMETRQCPGRDFTDDRLMVSGLLNRDAQVTRDFFYRRGFPLFKSIFDNYHTGCDSVMEFANDIYLHIMRPDPDSGVSKLERFEFRSSFFTWLKTVCIFYCYKRYERKSKIDTLRFSDNFDDEGVRIEYFRDSIDDDGLSLAPHDVETILRLMPNRRYSDLIRCRYLEGLTNEETALRMGMNMNTFYNKHNLAKAQYIKTLNRWCDG